LGRILPDIDGLLGIGEEPPDVEDVDVDPARPEPLWDPESEGEEA